MPGSTIFAAPPTFRQSLCWRVCTQLLMSLWISLSLGACGSDDPNNWTIDSGDINDSGLVFRTTHLILDKVNFGQKRRGSFYFENQTDQPLLINRIGPATCGCTTLTLKLPGRPGFEPRELHGGQIDIEIAAGEKAELEVLFDTSRNRKPISRRTDAFAVMVAGARGIRLQYSIDVWTPFWLEPWSVDLGRIGVRQQAKGFASVKGHDASHFSLIVPPEIDGWKFSADPIPGASIDSFNINFQAPDELPLGPFDIKLPIRTDLPDSPELYLSVRGIVVEDLDWSPRKIVLRPKENSATVLFKLHNRAPDHPVELHNVQLTGFPQGLIDIRAETLEAGNRYQVRLSVKSAPTERLEGKLLLRTDFQDRPHIEVPVVVLPRP
jgi:hypothetical protein